MNHQLNDLELAQLYEPALLITESPDQHDYLRNSLQQLIQPQTFIEHLWVADLVHGEHEIWRLRRFRGRIIRSNTPQALRNLLGLLTDVSESDEIDYLVAKWFTNKSVKRTVSRILRDLGSDEASIDAEALRLSIADVTLLDRRIAELELRRSKIFLRIEDHRAGLAVPVVTKLDQRPQINAAVSAESSDD